MIVLDVNLLLYAYVDTFPQHNAARDWLDSALNGSSRVGLPWPSLLAFVRLACNPRVFAPAVSVESAWRQVAHWLSCEVVWIPQPTARHAEILGELLISANANSNLVSDAHLAALAIEHGLTLCTTDGDFARFRGLRWQNPLRP